MNRRSLPVLFALPLWLAAVAAHLQPAQRLTWLLLVLAVALLLLLCAAILLHGLAGLLLVAGLVMGVWFAPLPLALLLLIGGWLALALFSLSREADSGWWMPSLVVWVVPALLLALVATLPQA